MTRKLPWKRASATAVKEDPEVPATPTPRANTYASPRLPPGRNTPPVTSARRIATSTGDQGYRPARTPSTSPPPLPIPEQHMIEGLDGDDRYRMVEDEFFSTAGMFTAYLHRAEYQRLKNQAKSQNAETIANISRPVVGSLTEMARKRQEDVLRKRKQQEALRQARLNTRNQDDSADEDNAPWRGTALQGLMDNSRKEDLPLTRLVRSPPSRSQTSRAVGSSSPPIPLSRVRKRPYDDASTQSDDEDDLDAGVTSRPQPGTGINAFQRPHATPATQRPATTSRLDSAPQASRTAPRHRAVEADSTPSRSLSSPVAKDRSDSEDSDPFTSFKGRKRREQERKRVIKKNTEPQGQKIPDIIPTFLL